MVKEIDGAIVIEYSTSSADYGYVEDEDGEKVWIRSLAICKYENGNEYYLFACDGNYNVFGDTVHNSIEEAKEFALSYYNDSSIVWDKKE